MIKELDTSKIDDVMKIWLETNISAHDFISKEYWEANYDLVKKALAEATVFVYEEGDEIRGFIGIIDESYIAGLFVSNQYQNEGIGSKLLKKCKEDYSVLSLDVYAKNIKAVNFYRKHGFKIKEEKENDETNEKEYSMIWKKL
jgi:ribosomal protein S18 acetylase RimI-like enzyme